jgi:tol-pal system protein YbgF
MKSLLKVLVITAVLVFFATDSIAQGTMEPTTDVRANVAHMMGEMQELRHQIEALKASIESNSHLVKSQTNSTSLKLSDMDARIGSLEERVKIQSRQVTSAVSTVAPEVAAEAELYQAGLNQVNDSEFLKAIATFKKFMSKHPGSQYLANAQYWIAECYFAMRDFEMAIKEFQRVISNHRRSEKVPAALLKQGFAFNELGMENDAKLFLKTLIKKHPRTKEAKEAERWLKREKQLKEDAASKPSRIQDGIPLAPGVVMQGDNKKSNRSNPTGKYE